MLEKIIEKIQLLPKKPNDGEVLCERCGGIGYLINKEYGYIEHCGECYGTGSKPVCEICGQPKWGMCKNRKCRVEIDRRNEQRLLDKATKCEIEEVSSEFTEMFYSESYGGEGFFTEIEELVEYCEDEDITIPDYVWATQKVELSLDAYGILESTCEELHEDALSNLTNINGLQELLDKWVDTQGGQSTYYPYYKYAIRVHKEAE